jgi:flagellar hook assembly protein FlgD
VGPVGVADPPPPTRLNLALAGANPTSGDTRLALDLPRDGNVRVKVYDAAGRVVRTLFDGWKSAGQHGIVWDGRDGAGSAAAVGLYFVRADAQGQSLTRRIARVR